MSDELQNLGLRMLDHAIQRADHAEAVLDRVRAIIDDPDESGSPHSCDRCGVLDGDWVLCRLRDALAPEEPDHE